MKSLMCKPLGPTKANEVCCVFRHGSNGLLVEYYVFATQHSSWKHRGSYCRIDSHGNEESSIKGIAALDGANVITTIVHIGKEQASTLLEINLAYHKLKHDGNLNNDPPYDLLCS